MLFANAASLAAGRPGAFRIVMAGDGLPAESMSSAIMARDGSIWAGSIGPSDLLEKPLRSDMGVRKNREHCVRRHERRPRPTGTRW
jgi:hypothetical protein